MQFLSQRVSISLGTRFFVRTHCAAAGAAVPELLGVGQQPLQQALTGSFSLTLLCILLFGKIALTSLCIAGVLWRYLPPALFVGAIAGVCLPKYCCCLARGTGRGYYCNAMAGVAAAVIGAPMTVTFWW